MPRGFWISHQMMPSMPWWFDEKISKIHPQNQKLRFFFTSNFWPIFAIFEKFSLIFSMGKFLTSIFCIFLTRILFYTKNSQKNGIICLYFWYLKMLLEVRPIRYQINSNWTLAIWISNHIRWPSFIFVLQMRSYVHILIPYIKIKYSLYFVSK